MTEEKRYFDRWEPLIAASLVKELEGLRLEAYLCPAGVPTIGYGHTKGVQLGTRISAEQADQLLTVDLERVRLQLMQSVKVPVSEGQFKALLSFAFNVGAAAVKDSTLLKYLNAGKFEAAQREFSRWAYSKGKRLPGLVRRRKREAEVFAS